MLQLTIRNITGTHTREANLSVSFPTRAGLCYRWIPQRGTRCCNNTTKSGWGGMGGLVLPTIQHMSPKGLSLCRARPGLTQCGSLGRSRTPQRSSGFVPQQGLWCSLYYGTRPQLPKVCWTTPFPMSHPPEQLEASQQIKVWSKGLAFLPLCNAFWRQAQIKAILKTTPGFSKLPSLQFFAVWGKQTPSVLSLKDLKTTETYFIGKAETKAQMRLLSWAETAPLLPLPPHLITLLL